MSLVCRAIRSWPTFRLSKDALQHKPMPNVTRLAERLLAADDVVEAQAVATELRAAIREHIERVREKARLIESRILPPRRDDSAVK